MVGGHAGGPLFEAPLGRAMDLRIDTGEVIGSDFTGTPWPTCRAFGAGPGTSERPGPGGPAQPQAEALRRGAAGPMRPHDASGACVACTLPRRPHPAGVRASGQRAATPPAAIGSRPARGTVRHPPRRAIPRPRFTVPHVEAPASRGKLRRSRPGEQFRHPSAGCSSTPVSRVGAAETCVPRKTLDAVGPGNGSPPRRAVPSGSARMSNSPPAVLRFTHPIRYPTASLISIGRQRCRSTAGHDARSCSSI